MMGMMRMMRTMRIMRMTRVMRVMRICEMKWATTVTVRNPLMTLILKKYTHCARSNYSSSASIPT